MALRKGFIPSAINIARIAQQQQLFKSKLLKISDQAGYVKVPLDSIVELRLFVWDAGNGTHQDHADWADARLIGIDGKVSYLSDLTPIHAAQGWNTLHKDYSVSGKKIKIGGTEYNKGLGTHSNSEIYFKLDKKYAWFETYIGADANAGEKASIQFEVIGIANK